MRGKETKSLNDRNRCKKDKLPSGSTPDPEDLKLFSYSMKHEISTAHKNQMCGVQSISVRIECLTRD